MEIGHTGPSESLMKSCGLQQFFRVCAFALPVSTICRAETIAGEVIGASDGHAMMEGKGAQQPDMSKFEPLPPGVKTGGPDIYAIKFVETLPLEDFERELQRMLKQYDAELANPADFGPGVKVKFSSLRLAVLHVPEARAKQIAADRLVVKVEQVSELVAVLSVEATQTLRLAGLSEPSRSVKKALDRQARKKRAVKK